MNLGSFATAEEAALCVARSPEGRAAAKRVASAPPPRMSDEEGQGKKNSMPSRAVLKEEGTVPLMSLGAFVKEEEIPSIPPGAFFNIKEEVVVKREHALIVDEGGRSDGRPKSAKVEGTSVDSFQMTIITCIAVFEASHANCKSILVYLFRPQCTNTDDRHRADPPESRHGIRRVLAARFSIYLSI